MSKKTAVVMYNLGGPDCLDAVKPFLFNLFYDPAIITVPNPFRWLFAMIISSKRAPIAQDIYRHMGGKSPILEETKKQSEALERVLEAEIDGEVKCFIFMRYWHPFADEAVEQVKSYDPDEIVLLPLYPQYRVTTTATGLIEWYKQAKLRGLSAPFKVIKEYPDHDFFVGTITDLICEKLQTIENKSGYRILFSAHGLPKKTIECGDPYQKQVEMTCVAVIEKLGVDELEHVVCYQSRIGPLEWIGPSIDDEIERAAKDGKNIIVVPVAFVSEHSETLVELDIEYKELADECGINDYIRINTVSDHPKFIRGLGELVMQNRILND